MHFLAKFFCFAVIILLSLFFVGCGAMFNGSNKTIQVNASPAGSQIATEPPIGDFTAPTSLTLERKHSYVLKFSKEGYKPATASIQKKVQFGIVFLDVFFTGLIGVVVDATTGAWNNLSPDQISVSLEKIEGANVPGPDTINICLTTLDDSESDYEWIIDCKESVLVSISEE